MDTSPNKKTTIGILAGYWSTNIGNAFFQLGAEYVLRKAMPDANIFLIGDQPGYFKVRGGTPTNALDYVGHLEIDAIVVLGPFLRPEFPELLGNMLMRLKKKGTKIIVLAAGMMQYDDATIQLGRSILEELRPEIFVTRDRETFDAFNDLSPNAYDGVDIATFVSDLFPPVPTDLPPYVVLNFDQIPEPAFKPGRHSGQQFEWRGNTWTVQHSKMLKLARRSQAAGFLLPYLRGKSELQSMDEFQVLRTDHRYNPFLPSRTYRLGSTYAGDIPHTYLNLYAHSQTTFTNRVHACVATLSYGNSAMLFSKSPRSYLLNRLGANNIKERPTTIDIGKLAEEKAKMTEWLGTVLSKPL